MRPIRSRVLASLAIAGTMAGFGLCSAAPASAAVTGAAFTTVDEGVDGAGHCQNGNPANNCNIYDGKQFVWLNGGPLSAQIGDGTYFFAVLEPGGQPGPNDGQAKNLSDDVDAYTNRTFSIASGAITYAGGHDFDSGKIRLADYADTSNPGGVYIMALCNLASGYPVSPRDCKYDAFKVRAADVQPAPQALSVVKDAAGTFDTRYRWSITKDVDRTLVKQVGGSATFTYTAAVTRDAGTAVNYHVTGTISVFNPNSDSGGATVPVTGVDIADTLSDGAVCSVTGGSGATLTEFQTDFAYVCDDSAATSGAASNTVVVSWPTQTLSIGDLAGDQADFTFAPISFSEATKVDGCVNVTDVFGTTPTTALGTTCASTSFTYQRTVPVPQFNCVYYANTATFTTDDSGTTGSAARSVTVCGPARTGALTMGFWQNKNGQAIITGGASTAGVCNSGTWLRQYAPFQDLAATATCAKVGTYVTTVIKPADASGASMNAMLKAQLLATALDVYFSSPTLGGNKIAAPAPIGGVQIDLTAVCHLLTSCTGTYRNVSAAFGGATSLSVSQILAYATSQSNAAGTIWYANVKAAQELAKDTFDAINNQAAFAA